MSLTQNSQLRISRLTEALVAYDSIFRRLFGYRNWESVTNLQHALKRPTWDELVEKRQAKFMLSVSQCPIFDS